MVRQKSIAEEARVKNASAAAMALNLIYRKVRSADPTDPAVYAVATNSNSPVRLRSGIGGGRRQ